MTARVVARLVNPRILGTAARGQRCSTCTHPAVVVLLVEGVPDFGMAACRRHTRPVFEELSAQYPPPQ